MPRGYKIFTHDFRSPLRGGELVWDGTVPFDLPPVQLDESDAECAAGWNFVRDIATGFQVAGMWPSGRPSVVAIVSAKRAIRRGHKMRAAELRIERLATEEEIRDGVRQFSALFGALAEEMTVEQIAWREALARPQVDEMSVRTGLERALKARGLPWELRPYPSARDAWAARAAWAARDAWDARAARDAWDALSQYYAARRGWVQNAPELLTVGVRDAYRAGLDLVIPTAPGELGYVMSSRRRPA